MRDTRGPRVNIEYLLSSIPRFAPFPDTAFYLFKFLPIIDYELFPYLLAELDVVQLHRGCNLSIEQMLNRLVGPLSIVL